jgi:hypothetical protein
MDVIEDRVAPEDAGLQQYAINRHIISAQSGRLAPRSRLAFRARDRIRLLHSALMTASVAPRRNTRFFGDTLAYSSAARMSDTRAQIRILLDRAAELRAQAQEIQRKLTAVFAQLTKLTARHANESPRPSREWRAGSDGPRNPDSQNE